MPVPTAGPLGYVFAGWYDGTGAAAVALTDDTGKSLGSWTYTGDMTLYAKWDVQEEMKNFQFESTSTTCIITGVIDKTVTELIVPNFVTSIANGAFSGCGKLEKLTIPFTGESRKTVNPDYNGKNCLGYVFGSTFYEGGVEVKQATGVKNDLRFYIPESLHYVKVTEVAKEYAFYNCSSITSLSLENITNQIQGNLCNGCVNLSSCTLPIGLKYIGYGAFSGCKNLKDFNLSDCLDTIIEISYDAFEGCTSLFEIEGNVVYVTQWAIGTVSKDITQINIRKGTIGIAAHAFSKCTKLLLVQMPETLKFVGSSSFTGCSALETLILPDSVRNIGSSAFSKCLSLRSITIPSKIEKVGQYFVEGCETLTFAEKDGIKYLGNEENPYIVVVYADKTLKNVILPSTVRVIADSAFKDCIDLVSVSLPAGVVTIENYAFWGCTALSKINIPDSVQNIGLAFELDKCLNSLYEVEDGIAYIGNWAIGIVDNTQTAYAIRKNTRGIAEYCFDRSKCLTITIPNTLCFIGDSAFLRCNVLEKIIYLGSKAQWQRCVIGHYGAGQLTMVIVEFIVE